MLRNVAKCLSNLHKANFGFTYIELLITLAIIAVLFVPVMQLFSQSLQSTGDSQSLITATSLAKWEMERVKNLNATEQQLKAIGNVIYPELGEEPMESSGFKWRIKREVMEGTDPLEIRVSVYHDHLMDNPVITLVTLVEDMTWEEMIKIR